ncbi:hypothetical protein BOV97_12895 [Solemya velum gill symbiont]|nr:hypothetical protein BOV97_12895 [Solemya velum gill symbiont]OOY58451.1 hypothetical protein BOW02_12350 [Solemya velum gill symbiont]
MHVAIFQTYEILENPADNVDITKFTSCRSAVYTYNDLNQEPNSIFYGGTIHVGNVNISVGNNQN